MSLTRVYYMGISNFHSQGLSQMNIRIKIGYALIGVTYVATLLSILLGCRPLSKNWQINPDPGSTCPDSRRV